MSTLKAQVRHIRRQFSSFRQQLRQLTTVVVDRCSSTRSQTMHASPTTPVDQPATLFTLTSLTPYTIGLVNRVESVQKIFTKKLPGMRNLHYEERLLVLSLESLEVRRIKNDLVNTCFKILKGMTSITCSEFFTLSGGCTRGHSLKLYYPDSRVNIRAQFFAIRVIDVWNRLLRLPPHIVTADTVASFVKDINSLCAHFLVPDFDCPDCSFLFFFFVACGHKCFS